MFWGLVETTIRFELIIISLGEMENSTCSGMGDFSFQKNSLLPLKFKQQIQQDPWKRGGFDQPTWLVVSEDSKHALASSFMFQDLNDRPTKRLFVDYIPETS